MSSGATTKEAKMANHVRSISILLWLSLVLGVFFNMVGCFGGPPQIPAEEVDAGNTDAGDEPECTRNADCADGQVCLDAQCVTAEASGCWHDGQCASGRICDRGACVPGDTTPSNNGDNNDIDHECDVDNDCEGSEVCVDGECVECEVDERTYYRDADGDGFGDPDRSTRVCTRPSGYVTNDDDCDDGDDLIHPDQVESTTAECADDVDNDCDGDEDEADADCDTTTDCDVDNDCMGSDVCVDGECVECEVDDDCASDEVCNSRNVCVSDSGDECDADADCTTSGMRQCVDGACEECEFDSNCASDERCNSTNRCVQDDTTDECDEDTDCEATERCSSGMCRARDCDTASVYPDADNDGYGDDDEDGVEVCEEDFRSTSTTDELANRRGDCDELRPLVNEGRGEICGNDLDDDCDGRVDETGCSNTATKTCYRDRDRDTYGDRATTRSVDEDDECPSGYEDRDSDCDDDDDQVNPGEDEVCVDGIDNDCNGLIDTRDLDACEDGGNNSGTDDGGNPSDLCGGDPVCLVNVVGSSQKEFCVRKSLFGGDCRANRFYILGDGQNGLQWSKRSNQLLPSSADDYTDSSDPDDVEFVCVDFDRCSDTGTVCGGGGNTNFTFLCEGEDGDDHWFQNGDGDFDNAFCSAEDDEGEIDDLCQTTGNNIFVFRVDESNSSVDPNAPRD